MYQFYQASRQQNANPNDLIKQLTANYDEVTKKRFKEQGKQFGLTEDYEMRFMLWKEVQELYLLYQ